MEDHPRFLLVTFPAQGHINPALQFAKRLIRIGVHVTLATCVSAQRKMMELSIPDGLSFATFSDGYDDGFKKGDDPNHHMSEMRRRGSETITNLIVTQANEGKPFSCLVYTILLPWAGQVASSLNLPSALVWIQPAIVFDLYYYYFNGYGDMFSKCKDSSYLVELPHLPSLKTCDLPSFLLPSNVYTFVLSGFKEQMETLRGETKPTILVNTFDAIEPEALKALNGFNIIGIGPLIPSAYLDGRDPNDKTFGGDLFQCSSNYIEYLNSKPKSSVVYVSFGSLALISAQQMEEIAKGLKASGHPFLWVLREDQENKYNDEKNDSEFHLRDELEQQGMIVRWCTQLEVLSHESLGCFVTHCGWNSTLESLVCGVPTVAFPQWTDQGTNAKLIEGVWGTGVRVVANEEGIVTSGEIERCLDSVMGDGHKGMEIRSKAKKWKELAREAVKDGGSSDNNLKSFVADVVRK